MEKDRRTKCNDCQGFLENGEMVYSVQYGFWNSTEFEENRQKEYYCQECWSERSPMRDGINMTVDSAEELIEILSSSNGKIVADFNSHSIGSRVFMRVINQQSEFAYVESRVVGEDSIDLKTEYEPKTIDEALKFTREILISGDLPSVIILSPADKTPFYNYPELDEEQESIYDF